MGMHTTKVAVGEGKFTLEAQLTVTPRGMVVYACSPEFAHLGATAQAIPRPEPGRTATVSILVVPCHRDEIPAHDIAAALATRFGVPVTASTGFHVEQASKDDLQSVLNTTKELMAAASANGARSIWLASSRASYISTKRKSRKYAAWPSPSSTAICKVIPSSWPPGSARPSAIRLSARPSPCNRCPNRPNIR